MENCLGVRRSDHPIDFGDLLDERKTEADTVGSAGGKRLEQVREHVGRRSLAKFDRSLQETPEPKSHKRTIWRLRATFGSSECDIN